ncbi:cytochrome P450 2D17-like [Octodon degus]|uniref:Cytochrome P450 2D17-like n=1 Tax=Octodon degus TaxID=10160 RepID=A0A6P6DEA1_OCTDE|nr:cytochrome P450 2D17-like [Octodon degus]
MGLLPGDALFSLAVAVVLFLLLVDLMHRRQCWAARYPPGPLPVPGLGNLLQVDFHNAAYSFYKLRSRFGDVFSLQLAWSPVVVVNGLEAVHEALVKHNEDTADRPPIPTYEHLGFRANSKGKACREKSGLVPQVLNAIPILLRIPGLAQKFLPLTKDLLHLLDNLLREHNMTWDPTQPPRDLTDAFLAEIEKAKGNPESSFNDANLRMVISDLFAAGMVTTATTLSWALLLMILHPDVQRRVQQEIDEVIGQGRRPEMADQARMPFTNAVVHEVQRFADIAPMTLPHMVSCDVELKGYLIPKGTMLITNLSSVLKDETVWEKPFHFHPGHFLDSEGHFVKHEGFMPFSAGPRMCLGEPLARMELFLFFTCLLQRFNFSVPQGQPRPSDCGMVSFLVAPAPYQLCAVPR